VSEGVREGRHIRSGISRRHEPWNDKAPETDAASHERMLESCCEYEVRRTAPLLISPE
jgi:hypothetical protein